MCKKLFFLIFFVLVLGLVGSAGADPVPSPWVSEWIGDDTPVGSSDWNPGAQTLAVTGAGHDIWDAADDFQYVYKEWSGDCDLIVRVASFPTGVNGWQKAGVMVRQNNSAGSAHCQMVVTGTNGGGAAMQWRDTQDGGSGWTGADAPGVTEPEFIRLTRTGNAFAAFNSEDGITWEPRGTHTTVMTDPVLIGFGVTSHDTPSLVTATYDNFGGDLTFIPPSMAHSPDPGHGDVDVPVDANLGWVRGDYCIQDEVYFGTDPVMANLPKIATLSSIQPALVDFTVDLVASTTYYWYVVETDANIVQHAPDEAWNFTTVRGEAQVRTPTDGSIILGEGYPFTPPYTHIYAVLDFIPGATAVSFTGYFSDDYAEVAGRVQDANLGSPPVPTKPTWYYVGMPLVPPAIESLVRGTVYYWTVDSKDALGNEFPGDIWEFSIQGFYAYAPDPPDGASFIAQDMVLSWNEGAQVSEHDVYMGTSWEDVNNAVYNPVPPPEFVATTTEPNQVITGLPKAVTQYWRVDEVYGRFMPGTGTYYKGEVWSFTVIPEGVGTVRADFWWDMTGALAELYADPDFPANPDETRILTEFDSGTALGDNYGAMIHGWLQVAESGDYTFWIATDDNSDLWLSTDESPSNLQLIASVSGWVDPYMWYVNASQESAPIPLVTGQKYYIRGVWEDGGGGDHCQVAWQGPDQPLTPESGNPAGIPYVIPGSRLMPFQQLWAHSPDPAQGQAGVGSPVMLGWGLGDSAAKHDVYLSTDRNLVDNRDAGAFKGRFDPNTYGPIVLAPAQVYYWAIDEVNDLGPSPGIWYGSTWAFRAAGGAGGLQGLYYHWDSSTLPPTVPGNVPPDPGPPNPFQLFVLSRIDPEVNFFWDAGTPDPNINIDYFGIKWVGHVECPVDANYTFYTTTDDGSRVFIDDVQIMPMEAWQQQGMTEWSGSVILTAGLHDIEFHFEEGNGGAGAQLRWSAIPTNPADYAVPKQIIPSMWLWPPLYAAGPQPPHLATIDDRKPALEFIPGLYALTHELYFSANYDDVKNRNPLVRQILVNPYRPPAASPLELGKTYYWLVDEVKSATERWDAKGVWEFTIAECISLDNFEVYNDRNDLRTVWTDGNHNVIWGGGYPFLHLVQGGSSGSNLNVSSAVGTPGAGTGPVPPTPLNFEAMVLRYDNDGMTYTGLPGEEKWVYDAPYFSEIEADTVADLGVGTTWSSEGVKSLTLWFQGHPISDGWYDTAGPWPLYTQAGRGRDIEGRHDEFHFFSKFPLTTPGTIQVQVLAIEDTNPWAKAGVMIREKWTPYSRFAAVYMTPGQGVSFQWRANEDGPIDLRTKPGITLPEFVKLERTTSGAFIAKHSDNGSSWYDVNSTTAPEQPPINMDDDGDPNLYMGTAVSSHDALATCTVNFNEVGMNPLPTNWVIGDIGTNDPEQLYVALSDGITTAVVEHDDVNAATLTEWQEWNILLTEFGGINLNNIQKVYIGLGDRVTHPVAGGSGAIYVDDFRACPPRCVAAYAKPDADIAVPYDCVVDEKDLAALAADYLMRDELIVTVPPNPANLLASYQFEGNYYDTSGNNHHLTDPCGSTPGFDTGTVGSFALTLDGFDDWLAADSNVGVDGNMPKTIACWAMADSTDMENWAMIFGFTRNTGGNDSHFNLGYSSAGIINDEPSFIAHVWGWEEQILPLDVGVWHHFAMTYDGTTIRYYGDGIEMDTQPGKSQVRDLSPNEDQVHIGKRGTHANSFHGKVDDARIYGYQLSKEEIAYIASGGAPSIHIPIPSDADLYQGEAPGSQWINLKDYSVLAEQYLDEILWP